MRSRGGLLALCLAGAALVPAAASAEVLTVSGVYPAASDAAAAMNTIAIERFGGSDGSDLAIRIEDGLRGVEIEGRPYFTVLADSFARNADGLLRGTATAEVTRERYSDKRERCVARNDKDKCTERGKVEVRCTRRRIELVPVIRLISRNGALAYSDNAGESEETSYCDGDSTQPGSTETAVREMADRIAGRTRAALAPAFRRESIRVLEDRKGLSAADGELFKNALRLTKIDAGAACRQWQTIAAANPAHGATAFNIGLCAEAANALDSAEMFYRRAAPLSASSSIAEGLRRIDARRRAARQLKAHFRP